MFSTPQQPTSLSQVTEHEITISPMHEALARPAGIEHGIDFKQRLLDCVLEFTSWGQAYDTFHEVEVPLEEFGLQEGNDRSKKFSKFSGNPQAAALFWEKKFNAVYAKLVAHTT